VAAAAIVFGITFVDSFQYADRLLMRIQVSEQSQTPLR
jgi:hypothetical protein